MYTYQFVVPTTGQQSCSYIYLHTYFPSKWFVASNRQQQLQRVGDGDVVVNRKMNRVCAPWLRVGGRGEDDGDSCRLLLDCDLSFCLCGKSTTVESAVQATTFWYVKLHSLSVLPEEYIITMSVPPPRREEEEVEVAIFRVLTLLQRYDAYRSVHAACSWLAGSTKKTGGEQPPTTPNE